MEAGFYSAAAYLHVSLMGVFGLSLNSLFIYGAIPVALSVVAIVSGISARTALLGAVTAAIVPFAMRWTLFGEIPNGQTPDWRGVWVVQGLALGTGFLLLAFLLVRAFKRRKRFSFRVRSGSGIVATVAVFAIVCSASYFFTLIWVAGALWGAEPGSAQWYGHSVGFGMYLFMINLVPMALAGAVSTRYLQGRMFQVLAAIFTAVAAWFAFRAFDGAWTNFVFHLKNTVAF